jgi:hypothetical protein
VVIMVGVGTPRGCGRGGGGEHAESFNKAGERELWFRSAPRTPLNESENGGIRNEVHYYPMSIA